MNHQLLKVSGFASLIAGFLYIVGFTVLLTTMSPLANETSDTQTKFLFLVDHQVLFQSWILLIYVLFGIILVFVIHGTTYLSNSWIGDTAAVFGYIWSGLVIASGMVATVGLEMTANLFTIKPEEAISHWAIIDTIHNALGGGV